MGILTELQRQKLVFHLLFLAYHSGRSNICACRKAKEFNFLRRNLLSISVTKALNASGLNHAILLLSLELCSRKRRQANVSVLSRARTNQIHRWNNHPTTPSPG